MNEIKPSAGIEFTDDYKEAKRKFFDFLTTANKLTPMQREQLARECLADLGASAFLQQFVEFMNRVRR